MLKLINRGICNLSQYNQPVVLIYDYEHDKQIKDNRSIHQKTVPQKFAKRYSNFIFHDKVN